MTYAIGTKVLIINGVLAEDRTLIGRATEVTGHVLAAPAWSTVSEEDYKEMHTVNESCPGEDGRGGSTTKYLYRDRDLMPLDPPEEGFDEESEREPVLVTVDLDRLVDGL